MPNESLALDRTFQALSNSTRREVVSRLGRGYASASDLAAPFGMALPSFMQHLQVLEAAGMVTSKKTGRTRVFQLVPERLIEAEHWMDTHRKQWEARLDQLDGLLMELKDNDQ